MMANWAVLLAEGDFYGARALCRQQFAEGADDPDSSWDLAEVEELWGDALFFAAEAGAAAHYQAAQAALFPTGMQFTSSDENRELSARLRRNWVTYFWEE